MTRQHTRRLIAALLTIATLAAGCGSDEPTAAATTVAAVAEDTTETATTTTTSSALEAAEPAEELSAGDLAPGNYTTDALGTSLELTIADAMLAEMVDPAMVMISDIERVNTVTESVAFFRPTGFANETDAELINAAGAYGGPVGDIDAWATAVGEVEVTNQAEVDIDGAAVTVATIVVTDGTAGRPNGCGPTPDDRCFNFATTGANPIPSFIVRTSEIYRVWIFDQGSELPLVAMAFADATNAAWLDDVAAPLVESVLLGDPQPHPVDLTVVPGADGVLDFAFQAIEPGEYTVNSLGTQMRLTVGDDWWVQPNDTTGFFVLTDPDSQGPGENDIVFIRANALTDPGNPTAPGAEQSGEWPLDDIEGWLDALIESVVVTNREATTLAGAPAYRFDIELAPDVTCGPEFCVGFVAHNPPSGKAFDPDFLYRVYWVDQAPFEPLAIVLGTADAGSDWFETAEALLATIEFGESAPHPLPDGNLWEFGIDSEVPAGPVEIPALGGLRFDLEAPAFLVQPPDAAILPLDGPGEVNVLLGGMNRAGDQLAVADDFAAILDDIGVTYTEGEGRAIAGFDARRFDLTNAPEPDFSLPPPIEFDNGFGWGPPTVGRFYVFETERGLVIAGAESYEDDSLLETATTLQDDLLDSLEFIDFTGE